MFPKTLDNAKVLYYTPKDNYGAIYYDTGEIFDYVHYLALCQYSNAVNTYYLFKINDSYEVIGDSCWDSIDECMGVVNSSYGGGILWIEAN